MMPDLRRITIVAISEHPGEHLQRAYSEEERRADMGMTIEYFPTTSSR